MNKQCYRIVFNAARGILMAVMEAATSQSKAGGTTKTQKRSRRAGVQASLSRLRLATVLAALGLSAWPLGAQVVADHSAPGKQQATVLQTANGTVQVNIQTPSAAGVSRNTYSQFDVPKAGVILNNSRTDTNTTLAGYVQGNPWLATGSARVILNEVNSSSASQLKGFVEVAGQRAEVIIANPAGIAVNGGGFLNASAVTLTTGTPVMNVGSLDSFQVRGGIVSIDGAGLDTSTADYTNILARAAQVNAGIWAKDLKVVTGANDISAASSTNPAVTANTAGTGPAPTYALDVAALGGMYAGKIYLVGTEAGLGVRNAGVIGATAGDVVLSNAGMLTNSGSIYASGNTTVNTQGSIANTGQGAIAALGNTTLNAQGTNAQINSEAGTTIAAGVDAIITAHDAFNVDGLVQASHNLTVQAAGIASNGQLLSQGDLNLGTNGDFNNTGTLNANGNANISSAGTVTNSGTLAAGQALNLAATNLNNAASGILCAAAATHIVLTDTLTNRGLIDSGNSAGTSLTWIEAQKVNNLGAGRIYGDNIAIGANALSNEAVIASRNALDIGVQTLTNSNGATILSLGDMTIGGSLDGNHRATGAADAVTNSAAQIQSVNGNVAITTGTLQNLNPTFSYQRGAGHDHRR